MVFCWNLATNFARHWDLERWNGTSMSGQYNIPFVSYYQITISGYRSNCCRKKGYSLVDPTAILFFTCLLGYVHT